MNALLRAAEGGILRESSMLQPHSLLWHYLWIAPNVVLLLLAVVMWRRGLIRQYPYFFAFAILGATEQLTIYIADISPAVQPLRWWQIFSVGLLVEGSMKFGVISEIISKSFYSYPSVAKLGKYMVRAITGTLILVAVTAAAYAPQDGRFGIISRSHLFEQTIYITETGLLLFVFVFAAYFRLRFSRPAFGIALGLAISASVHLATWAIAANAGLPNSRRVYLDFLNMATYHVCILLWFYFLLLPHKVSTKSTVPPSDHNLEVWNQEMERLLHS